MIHTIHLPPAQLEVGLKPPWTSINEFDIYIYIIIYLAWSQTFFCYGTKLATCRTCPCRESDLGHHRVRMGFDPESLRLIFYVPMRFPWYPPMICGAIRKIPMAPGPTDLLWGGWYGHHQSQRDCSRQRGPPRSIRVWFRTGGDIASHGGCCFPFWAINWFRKSFSLRKNKTMFGIYRLTILSVIHSI